MPCSPLQLAPKSRTAKSDTWSLKGATLAASGGVLRRCNKFLQESVAIREREHDVRLASYAA
jgi:hypothetical protein